MKSKTCLSYWLPKIETAGLPSPRTIVMDMPSEAFIEIYELVGDGKEPTGKADDFLRRLGEAASDIGFPCFLRTGLTSGKHEWDRTCYLRDLGSVGGHVAALVEYSEIVDFMGLPCDKWAVREFLPTVPVTICPQFRNMPVCREFRVFVGDANVMSWQPYWPMEALEQGGADITEKA